MDFSTIRTDHEDDDLRTDDLEEEDRPKTGCLVRGLRIFAGLVLLLLIFLALLPTLLSSAGVRRAVEARLNATLAPRSIALGDWSLGWVSPIRLNAITYTDPTQGLSCTIASVQVNRGLFGLLPVGALNFGTLTIQKPEITLVLPDEAKKPTSAVALPQKAPAEKASSSGFSLPLSDLRGKLVVREGSLNIGKKGMPPFIIPAFTVDVAINSYTTPIDLDVSMSLGSGALLLKGKCASIENCLKTPPRTLPEELTLTLQKLDLITVVPLLQAVTHQPLHLNGIADGAIKINVESATQVKINSGLMVSQFSMRSAGTATQQGDLALLADVDCAFPSITIKRFECVSPWIKAYANGQLWYDLLAKRMNGSLTAKANADMTATVRDFAPFMGWPISAQARPGALDIAFTVASDAKGFDIQNLQLTAPFASFTAQGRIDRLKSSGYLDLTTLSRDFRPFMTNMPPMVGRVDVDVITTLDEKAISLQSTVKLNEVVAELKPGQRVVVPQGLAKLHTSIPFEYNMVRNELRNGKFSFTAGDTTVDAQWIALAAAKTTSGDGPRKLALPTITGFTWSSQATLNSLRTQIGGFMPPALYARLAQANGTFILNATAACEKNQLEANINMGVQGLSIPLTNTAVFNLPSLKSSHIVTINGKDGTFTDRSDIVGKLAYSVDNTVRFSENALAIKLACKGPLEGDTLTIDTLNVDSELLTLKSTARLTDLKNSCHLNTEGTLALDFGQITKILAAQGFADVELTGRTQKPFVFSAPLAGGLPTLFSEGVMDFSLGLKSFDWMGLHAGTSDIQAVLKNGLLKTSYAPILNTGRLYLPAEVHMERGNLALQFPPRAQVLSNVQLTQELFEKMVIKSNPFFSGSTIQKGMFSLRLDEFSFVANQKTPDRGIAIDATLEAKDLILQPGPQMAELLAFVKMQAKQLSAPEMTIHTTVHNGRISVDPFTVNIDTYPIVFGGSIGFDNTIDYYVEVPITDRLLGKASNIAVLKNKKIRIPMTGTLDRPRVDYTKFTSELGRTITDTVKEVTTDFFKSLRNELSK